MNNVIQMLPMTVLLSVVTSCFLLLLDYIKRAALGINFSYKEVLLLGLLYFFVILSFLTLISFTTT